MKGLKNMNDQKRFGVIFSGGTAAGMNATLEYLCRYARKEGAKLIGFKYGWTGLIRNDTVEVTMKTTRGIAFEVGGTSLGSCSKVNVFNHDGNDYSEVCYQTYNSLRLDGIFVLGGDGTNRQANELNEKYPDMKFYWISATLDRDVAGCDDTIGFHTAVENAAEVIASMANDGKTMNRHVIIECMGRHTGLVTIHATDLAIRKYGIGIDMVLVPEIPFDLPAICNRIANTPYPLTIVMSEGIEIPIPDDMASCKKTRNSKHPAIIGHHIDLANTCRKLIAVLQPHTSVPIKSAIVGYMQRTGHLSSADTFLAEHCAQLAVREAMAQSESKAIIFRNGAFTAVPMHELAELNKNSGELKRQAFMDDAILSVIADQISAASFQKCWRK